MSCSRAKSLTTQYCNTSLQHNTATYYCNILLQLNMNVCTLSAARLKECVVVVRCSSMLQQHIEKKNTWKKMSNVMDLLTLSAARWKMSATCSTVTHIHAYTHTHTLTHAGGGNSQIKWAHPSIKRGCAHFICNTMENLCHLFDCDTHTHTCTHTHAGIKKSRSHTHTRVDTHIDTHTDARTHVRTHRRTEAHTCTHAHTLTLSHTHTHKHTRTRTHSREHTQSHKHLIMQTHAYTYTYSSLPPSWFNVCVYVYEKLIVYTYIYIYT